MAPVRSIAGVIRRWLKPNSSESEHILLGRRGEDLAVRYLKNAGCRILRRNFRAPRGGEIDVVCRDKRHNELVFVEVKTRTSEAFGRPMEAVDAKKRRLIIRGAMTWLRWLDMPDVTFRFDVVEVVNSEPPEIRWIENAFQLPDDFNY
ncbi:MAG: YraN family protein [Terrimicrobiaceae bacterium]|nr:YraN family protein [Terrimicrobiaceae bacterium]